MSHSNTIDFLPENGRYRTLLHATLAVMVVTTVANIAIGLHIACILLTTFGSLVCLGLSYREKIGISGLWDRASLLFLESFVLTGLYFFNGGLLGALPYYIVVANLSSVHLLPRQLLKVFTALQLLCFAFVVGIEHLFPHFIVPYESELAQRVDTAIGVVVVILFCNWTLGEIQEKSNRHHNRVVKAHRQLRTLVAHLEQSHRFTRHDLIGSLSSVEGILELRSGGDLDDKDALKMLVESLRGAQKLLQNPQQVAAQTPLGNPLRIEFEGLVSNAVLRYRPAALRKSQTISYRADAKPIVMGDELLLDSVVNNLLSNAIKYAPKNSDLEVLLTIQGSVAQLDVRDHGTAIPAHERTRLFQPYSEVSTKPTGGEDSTGLGLFIVNSIALQHGGEASYRQPESGSGNVFRVQLPLQA